MKAVAGALLIMLLAASFAAGQGGGSRTGLPPPDKRAVPATPAEGRRLSAQIEAERTALEAADREDPAPWRARVIELLDKELTTIRQLEGERTGKAAHATLVDRTNSEIDELHKKLAQAGKDDDPLPDPSDPNAEALLIRERDATDGQIKEQQKDKEAASGAENTALLDKETASRMLPGAKRALAEAQGDLTDFETDSREAALGGVSSEQARVMGEQVYEYRLKAAERQARLDALRLRAGDLSDARMDHARAEGALAEANLARLEGRRARIESLHEKAAASRMDRGRAEQASIAAKVDEVAPWARPYWALKLRLAEAELDLADLARRKRAIEARTAAGGDLAALSEDAHAEYQSFAGVEGKKPEVEDLVPTTSQALMQAIERREADLARVVAIQGEVRELRREAHDRLRAARASSGPGLSDEIDAARKTSVPPEGVEPAAGAEREAASPSSFEKLKSALKAAAASRAVLAGEYEQALGRAAGTLHETRVWREDTLLKYRSALLWTRDSTEISLESVDRARHDAAGAPAAIAAAVTGAARASLDWAAGAARQGRVLDLVLVFGALFAAGLALVIVRRTAAKKLRGGIPAWTALLAFAGVVLPLLAGAPRRTVAVCAAVFVAPLAVRAARTAIDLLFGAAPGARGLVGLPEAASRVLARTCVLVLRVSACLVPAAILLSVSGYRDRNPGFVDLLWLLNSIGCCVVILVVMLRPSGIRTILRSQERGERRAGILRTAVAVGYPALIGMVVFLLVLWSLSYRVAARYFLERFALSAAWICGAIVLRRWLARILFGARAPVEAPPAEVALDEARIEALGRQALADRLRHGLLTLAVLGPAAFFILDAWGLTGAGWDAAFSRPLRPLSETVTLGNALGALVTAWLAFFVVRSARDLLRFVILPRTKLDTGVRYTIVTLSTYALVALAAVVILGGQLKVDAAVIGGFVAFLGLGLGFGLQEIVNNFFSGIILLVERPLKVGDTVSIGGTTGKVDRINMRSTMIMTADNTGVIVPNKDLISSKVTNWSAGTPTIRESLPLGIAYGSDTATFKTVVMEVVHAHGLVLKHPAADLVFSAFGASSLDFTLRYWIRLSTSGSKVKSDLYYALDAAFRRHGIEMPFPTHDVHVRSFDAKSTPPPPLAAGEGRAGAPRDHHPDAARAAPGTPGEAAAGDGL